ncbi:hypothetical protein GWI33_011778 [Rhynchophorus ferrugineus]|uniref:Uncharacterized protein n=1 Tax=Rhynchophorus ferrugineus TaxID=354439 RepID=A0A834M850_RHYFE|nr:hypothetical protein GWI33_011778 [Rhynchophorus ferrugineus]
MNQQMSHPVQHRGGRAQLQSSINQNAVPKRSTVLKYSRLRSRFCARTVAYSLLMSITILAGVAHQGKSSRMSCGAEGRGTGDGRGERYINTPREDDARASLFSARRMQHIVDKSSLWRSISSPLRLRVQWVHWIKKYEIGDEK